MPRALLECDRLRKQHGVFEVDVTMEVALELRELGEADAVRRAAIRWRRVSAGQLPNQPQLITRILMLAFHHPNGVLDCAERAGVRPS